MRDFIAFAKEEITNSKGMINMIIENIDEEPEEIISAWDQFCRIQNEKITSECRIAKIQSLDNPLQ